MRLATRISVPLERKQKESTQFRKGKKFTRRTTTILSRGLVNRGCNRGHVWTWIARVGSVSLGFFKMSRKSRFRVVVIFSNESRLVSHMNWIISKVQKQNETIYFPVLLYFFATPNNFYDPEIPVGIPWTNIVITSSAEILQVLLPNIQISTWHNS